VARKTKLMQRVERAHDGRPLERLLPEMVNELGLSGTADELGVSKATLGYWQAGQLTAGLSSPAL
jgi:hypothetical protein